MEVLQFVLLGLGPGAVFGLLALGIVQIYRGSGVLNFAHGAMAMTAAFVFVDLRDNLGLPGPLAMVGGVVLAALLGWLTHVLVMRRLRDASPLTRAVATLGVLIVLQSLVVLRYGSDVRVVASTLPSSSWQIIPGLALGQDRVITVGVAVVLALGLAWVYRATRFGLATSAAAENRVAAAALAHSADRLAALNWTSGAALAGLAGVMVVPITGLGAVQLTLLVVPALAAALVGRFVSFPLVLAAALGIGIGQSVLARYVTVQGAADALPFLVIIMVLLLAGRSLPERGEGRLRLPDLGTGRVRPVPLLVVTAVVLVAIWFLLPDEWVYAIMTSGIIAVMALSLVAVTGYAAQLSLAQFALAGMGAWIAGQLVAAQGWPFELAALAAVLAAIPIGLLVGLPAVRSRGVNLAVITLGLGLVLEVMIFKNGDLTGGIYGTDIGTPTLFGINLSAIIRPERYATLVVVVLVVLGVLLANVRRSRVGRRMIAVRGNERAAAALGINVVEAKLYAFVLAAVIAAVGGVLLAFSNTRVVYDDYTVLASVNLVAWTVVGGVGYVIGPLFASFFAPGGIGTAITDLLGEGVESYLPLIGGLGLVLVLVQQPDGLAKPNIEFVHALARRVRRRSASRKPAPTSVQPVAAQPPRRRPAVGSLELSGVTMRFGGVTALNGVSLSVAPGEVVGLIGPNGAGKTTLIDAVTGFVRPQEGSIRLGDRKLDGLGAPARARAGVSRSFQSLELFAELSVADNLRAAGDSRDRLAYLTALVRPGQQELTAAAATAVAEFGLGEHFDRRPDELPYATRRLLAIARAVAAEPAILLLDEPAAGLDAGEVEHLRTVVRRLAEDWGIGVLLVEHNVDLVLGVSDRVVALDFGRVIASGTPDEVRADPAVVRAYLGAEDEPGQPAANDQEEEAAVR